MSPLVSPQQQEQRIGWFLLAPALGLLILVFAYPIGRAFWLSFFTRNLGTQLEPVFSQFSNYSRMMGDGRFWQSLWTTLVFTSVSVTLEVILGMAIALTLNQTFRGRGLVRTIAILPWALPTALIGLAWTWIFNDQFGVWNDLLMRVGILDSPINWLGTPRLAFLSTIAADIWKTTSFVAILLLAGLQSIPRDLYEAHGMDGATPWQSFRQITLPLLMPQILIAILFRFAQSFGVFDLIKVMTEGGPAGSTEMVSLYIYSTVMRYLDFGYGATLVVVTFLMLSSAVAIAALVLKKLRINVAEGTTP